MLQKWVTARWKIQETSSVFLSDLVSSKWLQKSIILDYLYYRAVEELSASRFMTFMVLVQETETEFLSVQYFDCSKYNCTCKQK